MNHFLIALALAMDCFAVSTVSGVVVRRFDWRLMLRLAFLFGLFQALMPLAGWALTTSFNSYIEAVDHWVAFGMLALIGVKMIVDAFKQEDEASVNPRSFKTQILLAIATSIDAMAIGVTYACTGYETISSLFLPLIIIGLVSFVLSLAGFSAGIKFGDVVNRKIRPELLGGLILIAIGVKILIEHLSA